MKRHEEAAEHLLRRAREDLELARHLGDAQTFPVRFIGFHAQQAVEKAIKAKLTRHDVIYPLTHDLQRLIELLSSHGLELPCDESTIKQLTPFAVLGRYGDADHLFGTPGLSVPEIIAATEAVVSWAAGE